MDVSVIVVTWNAKAYAIDCLTSLYRQSVPLTQVIVVDNASADGTPEAIADQFPAVTLIRNSYNIGFGAANNIGLRESTGTYLCLVNSDVSIPPACLETLLRFMDDSPSVGMVGPAMLGNDGRPRRSTMRFPTIWNSLCSALCIDSLFASVGAWGGAMMKDFEHNSIRDVEVLNGWFWIVRRAAVERIGLLDQRFFIYGEDIDWCQRFRDAGWRVVFNPAAGAVHYGGASSSRAPIRFYVEMQRANLQYWLKHRRQLAVVAFLCTSWLHHLLRVAGYAFVWSLGVARRPEAGYKIRRSWAALQYLWNVTTKPGLLGSERVLPK